MVEIDNNISLKIGYARISTSDQNKDLQIDSLRKAGCHRIFEDSISGVKTDRPGLTEALKFLNEGDTLVVWKLDRLGRSLKHLIEVVNDLAERGVGFTSIQENIDTTTNSGRLFFHVFGALAEFERGLIHERTAAGLKSARARGRLGGRPKKMTPLKIRLAKVMLEKNEHSIQEICDSLGISQTTLYRHVKQGNNLE